MTRPKQHRSPRKQHTPPHQKKAKSVVNHPPDKSTFSGVEKELESMEIENPKKPPFKRLSQAGKTIEVDSSGDEWEQSPPNDKEFAENKKVLDDLFPSSEEEDETKDTKKEVTKKAAATQKPPYVLRKPFPEAEEEANDSSGSDKTKVTSGSGNKIVSLPSEKQAQILASLVPKRGYTARYDIKVTVGPSVKADEALLEKLTEFLTKMFEVDPDLVIHPWVKGTNKATLTTPPSLAAVGSIPKRLAFFKPYALEMIPRVQGGYTFVPMLLGHSKPLEDIIASFDWWLKANNHNISKRSSQAAEIAVAGWLLYSTRELNKSRMKTILEEKTKLELGVRWMAIRNSNNNRKLAPVRAIHIEATVGQVTLAQRRLAEIYKVSQTSFPDGVKLRFVPTIDAYSNPESTAAALKLRARQATLTSRSGFQFIRSTEAESVDTYVTDVDFSLRDIVMAFKSNDFPDLPSLFLSVSDDEMGPGIIFTCLPDVESEARMRIASLYTYVVHFHGKEAARLFTSETADVHEGSRWDEQKNCAISEADVYVTSLLAADADYQFLEDIELPSESTKVNTATMMRPDPSYLQNTLFAEGGDSVGTLRGTQVPQWPATSTASTSSTSSLTSVDRTTTSAELLTLLQRIQEDPNTLSMEMAKLTSNPPSSTPRSNRPEQATAANSHVSAGAPTSNSGAGARS